MSASAFQVITVVFPDPVWNPGKKIKYTGLDPSVSFSLPPARGISTLSDNSLTPGSDVTGLLYTPDLDTSDPCYNVTQPYVLNATRQGSLPNEDWQLMALAPWISPACTLSYLKSAQYDPINAFIFYIPNNDTDAPPDASDPRWNLGDNGEWKKTSNFPVFAISGPVGSLLMRQSGQYSGNLTTVPDGNTLAQAWDPRDYVRLFVDVGITPSTSLPSLWVFLLIVLCILLFIIAATSISMHCLQRRRRQSLRQRVVNGEIDLEALGIQRMTVPQHILDEMPLFEFGSGKVLEEEQAKQREALASKAKHSDPVTKNGVATSTETPHSASPSTSTEPTLAEPPSFDNHMNQGTCAICLDDFIAATSDTPGSAVRQLPCHHIFHPECVDNFLRENSSLCPMCKHSALPVGYCPRNITNAMVRRERIIRRMRERADAGETADEPYSTRRVGLTRLGRLRDVFSRSRRDPPSLQGHAMAEVVQPQQPATLPSDTPPDPGSNNRREWARQRALAMLGRRTLVPEEQTEPRSRWRKVLGGVFPGVA